MVTTLCVSVRVSYLSCRCGISRLCDPVPCPFLLIGCSREQNIESLSIHMLQTWVEKSELGMGSVGHFCLYLAAIQAIHTTPKEKMFSSPNHLINRNSRCCPTQDLVAADQKIRRRIILYIYTHTHIHTYTYIYIDKHTVYTFMQANKHPRCK